MVNKRERLSEQDPAADRPARLPGTGPEGRPQKRPRPDPEARGSLWLRWPVGGSSPWRPVSSPAPGWGDGDSERGREWEEAGRPTPPPLGGSTALRTPRTQSLQLAVVSGLQTVRTSCCSQPRLWASVTAGRQTRALGCKRGPCRSRAVSRGRAPAPPAPVCVCVCPHFSRTSDLPAPRLQIQPHSALNPTSPNTRSNLTQHRIQQHPARKPKPLSTKLNLTQQQIQPHSAPSLTSHNSKS